MRPPLAGKRAAARRLAAQVRSRLAPAQRVAPGTQPARPPAPTPEDAAVRIDAARERLRASIRAPDDDRAG